MKPNRGILSLVLVSSAVLFSTERVLLGTDCNANGMEDAIDLAPGPFRLLVAPSFEAGPRPRSIIAADLTGRGGTDLVTVNGLISVLLNQGDGYGPAVEYAPLSYSVSVAATDLDGDGKRDLVTTNWRWEDGSSPPLPVPGSIFVFLNQGDGAFLPSTSYEARVGPSSITAADMNGDQNADLIITNQDWQGVDVNGSSMSVFLNRGDGTFLPRTDYLHRGVAGPAIAADLDGDAFLDIAVANSGSSGISVLLGQGGVFKEAISYPLPGIGLFSLVAADFDGDGTLDLAAASQGGPAVGGAWLLLNQGDGSLFVKRVSSTTQNGPDSLVATDLNRDGRIDLLAWDSTVSEVSVLLNDGGSRFHEDSLLVVPDGSRYTLVAADLDDDGDVDVGTEGRDRNRGLANHISVFLNNGNGRFGPPISYPVEGGPLIAADLNGDRRIDFATAGEQSGRVSVFLNSGGGTFFGAREHARDDPIFGAGLFSAEALEVDMNGDGLLDRVARADDVFSLLVSLNRGAEVFEDFPVDMGKTFMAFTAADLDGDRGLDLATDGIAVFFNDGSGSAGDLVFLPGRSHGIVAAVDLDGDRDLDLVTDQVSVFLNEGNGQFGDPASYPVGAGGHGGAWAGTHINADLDADGDVDLAVVTRAQWGLACGFRGCLGIDGLFIFLNHGDGTFDVAGPYPTGVMPASLLAVDLNFDAKLDLVVGNWLSADLYVYLGNDDGTFGGPSVFGWGLSLGTLGRIAAKDLDGDGRIDLAIEDAHGIAVFLNQTPPPHSRDVNRNGIPDECETRFHRADPNSSGTTDISDGIAIFGFLFLGSPTTLSCNESADANNDASIDISDGIYLLSWLFTGGPEPAAPGPTGMPCGLDPDPPGSPEDLGCEAYAGCH